MSAYLILSESCNGTGKGDDLHIECSDYDGTGKPVGFE